MDGVITQVKIISIPQGTGYALLWLWLVFTGGAAGWGVEPLLAINLLMAVALLLLMAANAWRYRDNQRLKPIQPALVGLFMALWVATAINQSAGGVGWMIIFVVFYIIYDLPAANLRAMRRGALWAGWVVWPAVLFLPWDNANTMAMSVWGLLLLGMPADTRNEIKIAWGVLGGLALLGTGSEGGIFALATAIVWLVGWWQLWLALIVVAVVGVGLKFDSYGSLWVRRDMIAAALADFRWLGHGLDSYHFSAGSNWSTWHAHNLVAQIIWDAGALGLAALAWLLASLRRLSLDKWSWAWLIAFGVHSLVDSPLYVNFFSGVVAMLILGSDDGTPD